MAFGEVMWDVWMVWSKWWWTGVMEGGGEGLREDCDGALWELAWTLTFW